MSKLWTELGGVEWRLNFPKKQTQRNKKENEKKNTHVCPKKKVEAKTKPKKEKVKNKKIKKKIISKTTHVCPKKKIEAKTKPTKKKVENKKKIISKAQILKKYRHINQQMQNNRKVRRHLEKEYERLENELDGWAKDLGVDFESFNVIMRVERSK